MNTTSRSQDDWSTGLSPFQLGPVNLYAGHRALRMENAWQFAKVYAEHVAQDGNPADTYWAWALRGWRSPIAQRYPKGKGAKPAYLWWNEEKLGYLDARRRVYFPLYRDAVRETAAFQRLSALVEEGPIVLFDFDGYDSEAQGMTLYDVLQNPRRPMGHAFVLKAMLTYGPEVTPEDLERGARQERERFAERSTVGRLSAAVPDRVADTSIFVFGANLAGRHGKGAALEARRRYGAQYGVGVGPTGQAYAIPTKSATLAVLPLDTIAQHVRDFLTYASAHPDLRFRVTRVGCGLAGYTDAQIGPMFLSAPPNCALPNEWLSLRRAAPRETLTSRNSIMTRSVQIQTSNLSLADKMRYSPLRVLKCAAGFYIGTTYWNPDGIEEPGTRDSIEYYPKRELAQAALENRSFTQRFDDVATSMPETHKIVVLAREDVRSVCEKIPGSLYAIEPSEIAFHFNENGLVIEHTLREEEMADARFALTNQAHRVLIASRDRVHHWAHEIEQAGLADPISRDVYAAYLDAVQQAEWAVDISDPDVERYATLMQAIAKDASERAREGQEIADVVRDRVARQHREASSSGPSV